jgi:hypothetical protein
MIMRSIIAVLGSQHDSQAEIESIHTAD